MSSCTSTQCYSYGNLNLDISNNQFALLYDMYSRFQTVYHGKEAEPLLSKADFLNYAPLVVIDCSKQNELLKTASGCPFGIRISEQFPRRNYGSLFNLAWSYCRLFTTRWWRHQARLNKSKPVWMEGTIKTRDSLRASSVCIKMSAVVDLQGFSE